MNTWIETCEEKEPQGILSRFDIVVIDVLVFQLPSWFQEVFSTAMSRSNGWINNLGLPIPDKVLAKVDTFLILIYF